MEEKAEGPAAAENMEEPEAVKESIEEPEEIGVRLQ